MFGSFRDGPSAAEYVPPERENENTGLTGNLTDDMIAIRARCSNSSDLIAKELSVAGLRLELLLCEGMYDASELSKLILTPLSELRCEKKTPSELLEWARGTLLGSDQRELRTVEEVFPELMSGFAVLLIERIDVGLSLGIQGFSFRQIDEPSSGVNIKGSREGFVEVVRVNMSMVRRRLRSPSLVFEMLRIGTKSRTDVCVAYMSDAVSQQLLNMVRERLKRVSIDALLDAGYLKPFLEDKKFSMFDGVGFTERPDVVCAKIREGRVAVLLDGTPFALILPFLFSEHFQTVDDYSQRPFFVLLMRLLRWSSFFISMLLPGLYVAIVTFHPELLPEPLLFNISSVEEGTPFSLMTEAFAIHIIYEIMREAGLRLPRPIGHAVGIIGALVVGDAAITSGLISAPMVMIAALTALSALVTPSLYESVTILKFAFIFFGGMWGIYGITLLFGAVMIDLLGRSICGVPLSTPISPTGLYSWRDIFLRIGWRRLSRENLRVQDLPGSGLRRGDGTE